MIINPSHTEICLRLREIAANLGDLGRNRMAGDLLDIADTLSSRRRPPGSASGGDRRSAAYLKQVKELA